MSEGLYMLNAVLVIGTASILIMIFIREAKYKLDGRDHDA